MAPSLQFVGREAELSSLLQSLERVRGGIGEAWLLSGPPGIGKSRLVEETARSAAAEGFAVRWGRCCEAGGAPAYWPWIQILRDVLRNCPEALREPSRAIHLAQLIPELQTSTVTRDASTLSAEQQRFVKLDAIAGALRHASETAPVLVVLEDLHSADPSSLAVLDFLVRQIRSAPLLILGTYRDAEADHAAVAQQLLQLAPDARLLSLRPLDRQEITDFVTTIVGKPSDTLVDTLAVKTEGNPLFLVELARLASLHADDPVAAVATVPPTLRAAISHRLRTLSPAARQVLELAAVGGRSFSIEGLAGSFDRDPDELRQVLTDCESLGVVQRQGASDYRFGHILIRDALYQSIAVQQRERMHRQIADALIESHRDKQAGVPWFEIAHHLLAAGPSSSAQATDAAECAAEQALGAMAIDEAIEAYRSALRALDSMPAADARRRLKLMLGLANALLRGGQLAAGRETCLAAAALSRALDDSRLLAQSALTLGTAMKFAQVDPVLVTLLREALDKLDEAEVAMRVRVMARLAAAQQPSLDPREPIALACRAVELARCVEDPSVLLAALRGACSTMVDIVNVNERAAFNREHVNLARSLDDRVETFRGYTRVAMDQFELGEVGAAELTIRDAQRVAKQLGHPFYGWRAVAFEATRALWRGEFAAAEERIQAAFSMGDGAGDPNAGDTYAYQCVRLFRLTGDIDRLRETLSTLARLFQGTLAAEDLARICTAANWLQVTDAGVPAVGVQEVERCVASGDRTAVEPLAELMRAGLAPLVSSFVERTTADGDVFVSSGVVGMTWDGPLARSRALLAQAAGQLDQAVDAMQRALEAARETGGTPMVAWLGEELTALLCQRASLGDRDRALAQLDEVQRLADDFGMKSVSSRAGQSRARLDRGASKTQVAKPRRTRSVLSLALEGDVWTVADGEQTLRFKSSKGMQYLARLVEKPGQEFHVLELTSTGNAVDGGDAGELLDEQARLAYRARIEALQAQIGSAAADCDPQATTRAQEEVEQLRRELGRAFGLGRRPRRAASATERARVNVQRRLKSAIARIRKEHFTLGRHLESAVRTGTFCSYQPE